MRQLDHRHGAARPRADRPAAGAVPDAAGRDPGADRHGAAGQRGAALPMHDLGGDGGAGQSGRRGHRRRRGGHQVPLRLGGLRHRGAVLQGRRQHRHPRRPPVDDRRGEPGHRHLHRRDGHRLAAGELRRPGGDHRQHHLRRLVLRPSRPLRRRRRHLRQRGRRQRAAARAGQTASTAPTASTATAPAAASRPTPISRPTTGSTSSSTPPATTPRRRRSPATARRRTPPACDQHHGHRDLQRADPGRRPSRWRSSPAPTAVSGTVGYDATTRTVTFTPTRRSAASTAHTATVSRATDPCGNTMAPFTWSFTTGATGIGLPVHDLGEHHDARRPCGQRQLGGRAGRQVPARPRGLHHRPAVLQGHRQHRHAHRVAVDQHRHPAVARSPSPARPRPAGRPRPCRTPVPVTANTTYVASYHTDTGFYSANSSGFASARSPEARSPRSPTVRTAPTGSTCTAAAASRPTPSSPPTTGSTSCSTPPPPTPRRRL